MNQTRVHEARFRRTLSWAGGGWMTSEPAPPAEPTPPRDPRELRALRRTTTDRAAFGPEQEPGRGRGLVLGRFLPPHRGHQYLIDFARTYASDLTVVLCSTPDDPIPGEQRYAWLRELFPDVYVMHLPDPVPPALDRDPAVRQHWAELVGHYLVKPDYLFASEAYGREVAELLGATYIPVDPERTGVPISATQIRADPLAHWEQIPLCVRPYFVRRVCLLGPESTGKSTLAKQLAEHFQTVAVAEYARTVRNTRGGELNPEDIQTIARAQLAAERALARQANRVLICDTNLLSLALWSERLFGHCPEWFRDQANRRHYDLYLVTEDDVPFVGDSAFDEPAERKAFLQRCLKELRSRQRHFARVRGDWQERFRRARSAVARLLKRQSRRSAAPPASEPPPPEVEPLD